MNNSTNNYVFNCPDNPIYMNVLQAIVVAFQIFQGIMSIWQKYDQGRLHQKVETNTNHILGHNKDIIQHKETLNQIKHIITSVGIEINEINSNQKKSMDLFAQISEQSSNTQNIHNGQEMAFQGQYCDLLEKEIYGSTSKTAINGNGPLKINLIQRDDQITSPNRDPKYLQKEEDIDICSIKQNSETFSSIGESNEIKSVTKTQVKQNGFPN